MNRPSALNWTWPLRHPLVLVVLVYVVIVFFGAGGGAKLLLLEPVAIAGGAASEPDLADLPVDQQASRRIRDLQDEVTKLTASNNLLAQAGTQLQDLAGSGSGVSPNDVIPARITLRGDASNTRNSIYINRGTAQGVKRGYPVCVGRTLVGVVTECSPDVSLISLLTDPAVAVGVTILPRDAQKRAAALQKALPGVGEKLSIADEPETELAPVKIQHAPRGIMRGDPVSGTRLPVLPIDDVDINGQVAAGMSVLTNEASGKFPAGLLVGYVESVSTRNTFLSVKVRAAADVSDVDVVLVIPYEPPSLEALARIMAGNRGLDEKTPGTKAEVKRK
jgi:cell shape-determining protein MreC